ncbi:hypothetical protein SPRG_09995 [Saprolegnia parasitica CBS 223.65]|uniref:Rhodanese domain-containing protein n=1 Tax=Saprolegnia parasitica (strain CBS 223.65) TaxID=695850 RepID=A0A067C8U1_SAPPC|nr:hypothetical protein SPRG_09995 [Saprolegnia parasitica CBS 223.65]KDO23187.1 hypothetical protein SPRG_09995 [Saprolegnia parasitica CBS 223.65]|eukprot:XP_012206139.1 hypothetical protein SPRG_09995 [Saprolegnia parasitica CBS 223.65]
MWGLRRHATAPSLRRSSSLWHQSFSRRAPYRPQNLGLLQYISFYQYTKLEASGLPKLRHQLLADWQRFGVMGRVYIAEEGINAQITVPMTRLDDFKAYLDTLDWLDDALLNLGAVLDHNDATPEGKCPFHTLHVRVRPHLAHDGLDKSLSMDDRGIELSPADWHEALSSPTHKRIFDCRNYYEHDVGRFEGAERIMVDTFKDTWASLDALLDGSPKDTECMIYCTGGIRCEKVGAYLKTNGYTNVKRLQGGIVHYGKFVREHNLSSKFLGRNFVFDQRLSNDDQALSDDVLGQCYQCGAPTNTHVNCANTLCHGLVLQCDACHAAFDGACTSECQRIKHEMDHHLVPNARVRPGNPFHARSYSTYHISEATMSPELNDYVHDVSRIPASDSQLSAWRDAIGRDFSDDLMQKMISPGQAKALQFLVQALSASKVLEVGCFTGYSAVAMALALPHGHVTTCDIDPKAIAWTRAQLATSSISNVTVHAQPGLDLLAATQETFDFAFIDGSKKDYVAVYEALVASDRLLAPKSWIVFDNTLFRGQVVEHAYGRGKPNEKTASQLMDFNKHVASDARTRSVVLPMYDGLTLVQKL